MQYFRSFAVVALLSAPLWSGAPARAQSAPPPTAGSRAGAEPTAMVRMESYGTLASFFNMAAGTVRIVAVLSPASPDTPRILEAITAVLAANPSRRLRAYVVMCRVDPADGEIRALNHMMHFADRRMTYLWDTNAVAKDAFRDAVGSESEPVVGACLLYDTAARFTKSPAVPALWMSDNARLAGRALDAELLRRETDERVRRIEARADEAARSGTKQP